MCLQVQPGHGDLSPPTHTAVMQLPYGALLFLFFFASILLWNHAETTGKYEPHGHECKLSGISYKLAVNKLNSFL